MKALQRSFIFLLSLSLPLLNSCSRPDIHTLTVVCDSSETARVPFHLLYMTDQGSSSKGFLETHYTPFQLELIGTDFIVIISDSIENGPRLYSRLTSRAGGPGIWGSPVLFRPGEVGGLY